MGSTVGLSDVVGVSDGVVRGGRVSEVGGSGVGVSVGVGDSVGVGEVDSVGDRDGVLVGVRVGLGSEPVIVSLGEGTSTDPSPPHEVRSMASSRPAAGLVAVAIRFVPTAVGVTRGPPS